MFAKLMNRGSSGSTASPPSVEEQQQTLLSSPWRKESWKDNDRNLQYVREYQPEDVPHLRVLLYGPVGAGKSCFINSVSSVLRGRIAIPAGVSVTTSDKSDTKKYKTHKIKKTSENHYPIVFSDTMGLEDGSGNGVRVDDIKLAMMGHINEDYKFNPVSALSQGDPGYNPSPSPGDKVHVLVCVHSANSAEITESVLQKMKEIREKASDLGIPHVAVITKIEEACCEKDLKNVYRSKHLKKKMSDFSSALGIPINCIFPVKNYSEETSMDPRVDTLILDALRPIINFGDDFLDKPPGECEAEKTTTDRGSDGDPCPPSKVEGECESEKSTTGGESEGGPCTTSKAKRSSLFSWPTLSQSNTVRVSYVVTGQTFGAHEIILDKVTKVGWSTSPTNRLDSNILIIFCPITSCVESDVETAIQSIQDLLADKDVILVLMHRTWKADYSTGGGRNTYPGCVKVVLCVDVLFHETVQKGFLNCQKNDDGLNEIRKTILKYSH